MDYGPWTNGLWTMEYFVMTYLRDARHHTSLDIRTNHCSNLAHLKCTTVA